MWWPLLKLGGPEFVILMRHFLSFLCIFLNGNKPFCTSKCTCARTAKQEDICSRNQTTKQPTCKKTTHVQEFPKAPFPSMWVATHGSCYTIQYVALNRHNFVNFYPIFIILSTYCSASKGEQNGTRQPV